MPQREVAVVTGSAGGIGYETLC